MFWCVFFSSDILFGTPLTTIPNLDGNQKRAGSGEEHMAGSRAEVWLKWKYILERVVKDVLGKEGGKEADA